MDSELAELLRLARTVVEATVRGDLPPSMSLPSASRPYGGVFVTLRRMRRLRGCMGTLDHARPLAESVCGVAVDAALHDPRFPPVGVGELRDLRMELSVLSIPWRAPDPLALEVGRHGILVRHGPRRGLFLPEVAVDHRLSRVAFLERCCTEKAGIDANAWRDPDCQVYFFTTEKASEPDD